MPVYRYKFSGVDVDSIKKRVPPADAGSVSSGSSTSYVLWDVTALATSKSDLDDYMASLGWTYVEQDPTDTPSEAAYDAESAWNDDEYVATAGQTIFTLSATPIDTATLSFTVNGVAYDEPGDYTLSGVNVTWLNLFTLDAGDRVRIQYK